MRERVHRDGAIVAQRWHDVPDGTLPTGSLPVYGTWLPAVRCTFEDTVGLLERDLTVVIRLVLSERSNTFVSRSYATGLFKWSQERLPAPTPCVLPEAASQPARMRPDADWQLHR